MSTQKVFRLASVGSHRNLKEHSEPIPEVNPHEILLKIRGLALNFRDVAITVGLYPFPVKDQVVPCSDAAGEVVKVGSLVEDLKIGDQVIAVFDTNSLYGPLKDANHGHGGPIDGFLREYAALPASCVVKVPDGAQLSFTQMAALVCTGVTAYNALYGSIPLKPGQTVLFQGTGGVSITGLMLAKAAGARTIITSSSDGKLSYVQKKYGADHTINYKTTPDWASEANKLTGGEGVDYIFENGGAGTIGQSLSCIKRGGTVAVIGFLSQSKQEDMPNVAALALAKSCIIRGITVGSRQLLEELVQFVVAKGLEPPVEKSFDFNQEGVMAAYEYMQTGQHIGKVCLSIN